jgi:prepilin peptidase CpaA
MSSVLLLQIVAIPLLCFAAVRDIATRLIPDGVSIGILAAGIVSRATIGWTEAGLSLLVGIGVFALLLPLAMRGMLGGGDVKLMAALAAGLPPLETWTFVVATVLAGGVLGLAYIAGRYVMPEPRLVPGGPIVRRVLAVEARRVRRRGPLPYAVAIAIGGTLVLLNLPGA